MEYKINDFKKGEKAYIELTGNASRYKKPNSEECIIECVIDSVGKKYVIANGVKFEGHNFSYGGLIEHTNYCVDYVLYKSKQEILDKFERENLYSKIKSVFSPHFNKITLEKLRKINEILEDNDISKIDT